MKKYVILGLGLMGGSVALSLKKASQIVYGVDNDSKTILYAKENGIVDDASLSLDKFINDFDVLIIATYPKNIKDVLKGYKFKEGQVITDLAGVKSSFIEEVYELVKPAKYISCHPMAGRETKGIQNAISNLFLDCNFLITPLNKDADVSEIVLLAKLLGTSKIKVIDPMYHDKLVALTSQLAHVMAIALVNSDGFLDTKNFIGDSYRDLTRIAKINSELWCELFLENKNNLLKAIDDFKNELNCLEDAIINEDYASLNELLKKACTKRINMEK